MSDYFIYEIDRAAFNAWWDNRFRLVRSARLPCTDIEWGLRSTLYVVLPNGSRRRIGNKA